MSRDSAPEPVRDDALGRRLFPDGEEPDARFTLANERTFLAWIRTALAFVAAGVAIEAFTLGSLPPGVRKGFAVAVIAVGVLIAVGAGFRWWRVETAMRRKRPLPVPGIVPLLGVVAAAGAVVAAVLVVSA
ncbi:MAG: DUF202 domain-containing protein [Arthrobacter sp.]|jgi:putative membrane protein|nr:DUF202 domain-containing protein [Arthrobacter sp.]